jgi:hypothetical protein
MTVKLWISYLCYLEHVNLNLGTGEEALAFFTTTFPSCEKAVTWSH